MDLKRVIGSQKLLIPEAIRELYVKFRVHFSQSQGNQVLVFLALYSQ